MIQRVCVKLASLKDKQNMRKDNMQRSSGSLLGRSATRTSEGDTLPPPPGFWAKWIVWIVLLVSLFITVFAWHLVRGLTMERAHDRFVFQSNTIESALHERMRACEFLLQSGVGLFAGSEGVTRAEWRTYVSGLQVDKYYQGVQGLGFSKRILPSEKKAHIRQIREEGFSNYDIQPDGDRPEYTSIIFLEPFDWRNQRAFGYDMFSEPTRKEAMVKARDTGLPAVSGKVTLLQETDKDVQAGFLMYLPVYRKGPVPETPEQRREALTGYVYSPFRMNDFMRGLLYEKRGYVELQIFDGDKPLKDALIYPGGDSESLILHSGHPHFFTHQSVIEYAGRHWLLIFKSSQYFEETIDTGPVNVLLLLGIIISLLLFVAVLSLTRSRNQALSLANMSLDLERANLGLREEIVERKRAAEALEEEGIRLQKAMDDIRTLRGIVPICSHCKKIRDDKGYWNQIESYIRDHSEAEFSHSICQECAEKYYPGIDICGDKETQG
jgi:CHASE1-domain containing sensor protein